MRASHRYAEGTISGGNARCVALLNAFKEVILDYVTPPDKVKTHAHCFIPVASVVGGVAIFVLVYFDVFVVLMP